MPLLLLIFLATFVNASELLERTQVMMGTFATLKLPQHHRYEMQQSFKILKEVEQALSSYDTKAEVYRLNQHETFEVSTYTLEALLFSRRYYKESQGYFDITIGSLTKNLYGFGELERLASAAELKRAVLNMEGIHIEKSTVWLDDNVTIDLGGMGKGFGVDKVVAYLHEQNISEGVVALSGDIRCLDRCAIEIQDPFSEGVMASITTKPPNMAISTSGNYRRYIQDTHHNHLINPNSKASQQHFASITLVSDGSSSDLDAYATAASVMPVALAIRFLDERGVGYVLITTTSERLVSKNSSFWMKDLLFTK